MTITIGVLGAARIVPRALTQPAATLDGVEVTAVAARDPRRVADYAARHSIPRTLRSYDELVEDPEIDAVYIPTPAALHGYWMRRAIHAGKHVLCEKPFTANADEAEAIAELASGGDIVVMEAFHSVHHPLWQRLTELIASGTIGGIESARASFVVPHADRSDIRWQHELGGGALMDLGVYPVRLLRHLFGEPEILGARAEHLDYVDAAMTAQLCFTGGITAEATASMRAQDQLGAELSLIGTTGNLHLRSPYHAHYNAEITVTTESGVATEATASRTTYSYQLQRFRDAIRDGLAVVTDATEATATMRVVDGIYRAAGMSPRTPLASNDIAQGDRRAT